MDEKKQGILNMAKNYLLLQFVLSTDLMTLKCYEKDFSNVMYLCIYILLQWRLKDPAYNFDKTNSLTCRQWIQTISNKQVVKIESMGILGVRGRNEGRGRIEDL